jgi:hypothetical protein
MIMMGLAFFLQILDINTESSGPGPDTKLLTTIRLTNTLNLLGLHAKAISQ